MKRVNKSKLIGLIAAIAVSASIFTVSAVTASADAPVITFDENVPTATANLLDSDNYFAVGETIQPVTLDGVTENPYSFKITAVTIEAGNKVTYTMKMLNTPCDIEVKMCEDDMWANEVLRPDYEFKS